MATRIVAAVLDPGSADSLRMRAVTEDGHEMTLDADGQRHDGTAVGPKEMLLVALAGCTAMDVISILRKKRQGTLRYEVTVSGDSADEHPRVYTHIRVEHRVGGAVEPEALRRAVELSATRYCPVSAMLAGSVRIEHRYRLEVPGEEPIAARVVVTGPDAPPAAG
ncbi:MAG TPA: OsmC family protein [Candidatus Limnocylindria bacterium]|nr:OsmC family protein [Candidatus Limnocylindria bacterium]